MAELSGRNGKLQIGKFPYTFPIDFLSGSTVSGVGEWALDYKSYVAETTDFEDAGIKSYIISDSDWLVVFEGLKDGIPLNFGEEVTIYLYESDSGSTIYYGQGIIYEVKPRTGIDNSVVYMYTLQGFGDLMSYTN